MNEDIKRLRSELALLKLQFSERIGDVESRLNHLLDEEKFTQHENSPSSAQPDHTSELAVGLAATNEVATSELNNDSAVKKDHGKPLATSQQITPQAIQEKAPAKPSFIMVFIQSIMSSFFDWFAPVTNIYQSYKERGMLGIFVLTILGIGLTLAGFGYLMQLLIDELGAGSKSLLMSFASILVLGLGITLKIKTRFGEFATAIVTLGILIAYSTIYFSGSVYGLLPNVAVLILYLFIALGCHAIALWLDTKVVAALGVVGIATMPILSGTIALEPIYYLLSFAFVVCSSLVLAFRHVGHWLAQLTLAFTLVSLEWIVGFESISISAWAVNLFYLLFFSYVVVSLLRENTSNKPLFVYLAALVASIVLLFFQSASIYTTQIGVSFVLNAMVAVAVSVFFYKVKRDLCALFILLAATWGVLAIVSVVSNAYWGVAWAIEGLLLLAIGRLYKISPTVNQGQILTAVALLYSFSALAMHFPLPALKSVDGWLLSIIVVAVIAVWQRIINTSEVFNSVTQRKVKPFLQWLEAVWLSVLLIASANIWLGNWTGAIVILLQLALLFRARACKQIAIEAFAAVLIVVPLFYVYQGAVLVDSYRFTTLPLFAKLSVISAFAQLWLWSAYYRKYYADSALRFVAEAARILFYMLIPICWVGSVVRRFDEVSIILLWLSPLLALFFARKIGHHLLIKETKILTGLASIGFIAANVSDKLSSLNVFAALIGFSAFYVISYLLNRKNEAPIYQFICSWGVVSLGIAVPAIVGFQTNSLLYGLVFASAYWSLAFSCIHTSSHLNRNEIFITASALILVLVSWVLIPSSFGYALMPTIFLLSTMYQKEARFKRSKLNGLFKTHGDLFLHSVLAVTYVVLLYSLTEYRVELLIAPVLAIHGALILFLKDRRLTTVKYAFALMSLGIVKLAFIDAANALLWQKVILFMGIGVFILGASFWYQKLISGTQSQTIDVHN